MYVSKIGILTAALESFPGLDAAPVASNAIEAMSVNVEHDVKVLQRENTAKRSHGELLHAHGVRFARISFTVDAKGTNQAALGQSTLVERLHPLLVASRFAATYNAPESNNPNTGNVSYALSNTTETTATIYVYQDGRLQKFHACVAETFESVFDGEDLCTMRFVFLGIIGAKSATAIPSDVEDYFPSHPTGILAFPMKSPRWMDSAKVCTLLDTGSDGQNPNITHFDATLLSGTDIKAAFMYDRTKDNLSTPWYNNALKSWWSVIGGNFPQRAWLVLSATNFYIYDADTNTLKATLPLGASKWIATGLTYNRVFALNGVIYIATSAKLFTIELNNDRFGRYDTSGYTYSDIAISAYASNCTYGNNTAGLAIVDDDTRHVHGNIVGGETVIAVSTANGLTCVNLSDATAYDYVQNFTNNAVSSAFVTTGGQVYWCSQGHAANTDFAYGLRSPLPSADDTTIALGATHKAFFCLAGGSDADQFYMDFGSFGSSGNASWTSVGVLEGQSLVTAGRNRVVFGIGTKGAVLVDESSSLASSTWQRLTQDYVTSPIYEQTVFAGGFEEQTISSVVLNNTARGFEPTAVALTYVTDTRFGKVINFDGTTSYANFANTGSAGENYRIDGGAFSFSIWAYFDTLPAHTLVNKNTYQLQVASDGSVQFFVRDSSAGGHIGKQAAAGTVTTGVWYQFVCTCDGGTTTTLTINDVAYATANSSGSFTDTHDHAMDLLIGCESVGPVAFALDGKIHGFQFWNGKALSTAEIARDYRAGLYRADGSCFLAGTSDVVNDVRIDPLHRLFIATANQATVINGITNAQETSYNTIGVNACADNFGDWRALPTSSGIRVVYQGATAIDYSGGSRHMRNRGGIKASTNPAYSGMAMTLASASSQCFESTYDSGLDVTTGNWSFGILFKHDTISAADTLFDRRDLTGTGIYLEMTSTGTLKLGISDDSGVSEDALTSASEYDDNAWHHVAVTRSGTTLTMYVDGTSVGTATVTNAAATLSGAYPKLRIGSKYGASLSQLWDGALQAFHCELSAWSAERVLDIASHFGGYYQIRSATVTVKHDIEMVINPALASRHYIAKPKIAGMDATLKASAQFPDVSKHDIISKFNTNNPDVRRLVLQANDDGLSNANVRCQLVCNMAYKGPLAIVDVNGILFADIDAGLYETAGNIDDALKLIFL